jgi:hypothetical protein
MTPRDWRDFLFPFYIAIAVLLLAGAQLWRLLDPASLWPQLREHAPLEMSEFIVAVLAFLLSGWAAWSNWSQGRPCAGWLGLSLFAFFVAGEEVTWGQDLIGFGHVVILGMYVDVVHDLFDVALVAMARSLEWIGLYGQILCGLVVGLAVTLLAVKAITSWPWMREMISRQFGARSAWFLVVGFACGLLAAGVDSQVLFGRDEITELTRRSLEEPLEFLTGLAMLFAVLARDRLDRVQILA